MSAGPWLSILGIGEDGVEGLTAQARALLRSASLVVGGRRHLALAAPLIAGECEPWPSPIEAAVPRLLARRPAPVAVLASGDPFWFGVGATVARHVPAAEMVCVPAPSAFSLACARLGWATQDAALLSVCGRPVEALRPALHPGRRLLVLCADASSPAAVAALLGRYGFGGSTLHLLEALGGSAERRRTVRADAPMPDDVAPLVTLGVELVASPGAAWLPLGGSLPDAWFETDGQLTKQEVRAATLAALAPCPGELLWDIGAGSGSVGIEWMLRHPSCRTIALEPRADRAARARRNAVSLGVPGLTLVEAPAPDGLRDLPTPDAVFLGGGTTVPGVLPAVWHALRPGGRLVANAVTIETERALFDARDRHGGTLTRLSVERLDRIGGMHGFRPAMTVTQWIATRP